MEAKRETVSDEAILAFYAREVYFLQGRNRALEGRMTEYLDALNKATFLEAEKLRLGQLLAQTEKRLAVAEQEVQQGFEEEREAWKQRLWVREEECKHLHRLLRRKRKR